MSALGKLCLISVDNDEKTVQCLDSSLKNLTWFTGKFDNKSDQINIDSKDGKFKVHHVNYLLKIIDQSSILLDIPCDPETWNGILHAQDHLNSNNKFINFDNLLKYFQLNGNYLSINKITWLTQSSHETLTAVLLEMETIQIRSTTLRQVRFASNMTSLDNINNIQLDSFTIEMIITKFLKLYCHYAHWNEIDQKYDKNGNNKLIEPVHRNVIKIGFKNLALSDVAQIKKLWPQIQFIGKDIIKMIETIIEVLLNTKSTNIPIIVDNSSKQLICFIFWHIANNNLNFASDILTFHNVIFAEWILQMQHMSYCGVISYNFPVMVKLSSYNWYEMLKIAAKRSDTYLYNCIKGRTENVAETKLFSRVVTQCAQILDTFFRLIRKCTQQCTTNQLAADPKMWHTPLADQCYWMQFYSFKLTKLRSVLHEQFEGKHDDVYINDPSKIQEAFAMKEYQSLATSEFIADKLIKNFNSQQAQKYASVLVDYQFQHKKISLNDTDTKWIPKLNDMDLKYLEQVMGVTWSIIC